MQIIHRCADYLKCIHSMLVYFWWIYLISLIAAFVFPMSLLFWAEVWKNGWSFANQIPYFHDQRRHFESMLRKNKCFELQLRGFLSWKAKRRHNARAEYLLPMYIKARDVLTWPGAAPPSGSTEAEQLSGLFTIIESWTNSQRIAGCFKIWNAWITQTKASEKLPP